MASTRPPVHELQFLKLTANHLEFDRKLNELHLPNPALCQQAEYVGAAWFHLGDEHLVEAKALLRLKSPPYRAIYSRSYYAAYNASKSIRHLTVGFVSLKGDDHGKAAELPGDFPDKEKWAKSISILYENRLRADYDNWSTTANESDLHNRSPRRADSAPKNRPAPTPPFPARATSARGAAPCRSSSSARPR